MKLSVRRLLAASTAAAVATAGTLAMTTTVDAAPGTVTKVAAKKVDKKKSKKAKKVSYGMSGRAFGTRITADALGVRSGKTAYSFVGCTTGNKARTESLLGADVLPNSSFLDVGVVRTQTLSRKGKKAVKAGFPKGTKAGTIASAKVADVTLAGLGPLNLKLEGLTSEARAWVTKKGTFRTSQAHKILDIHANTGIGPLDDLLNNSNSPLKSLIDVLTGRVLKDVLADQIVNGVLRITGLGEFNLSKSTSRANKKQALSAATVLQVRLYGTDGKRGGTDDINVQLGFARAKVMKGFEKGRFAGHATALHGNLLDGVLQTAQLSHQPIPCTGTNGKWIKEGVAGVDLLGLGLVKVDGVYTEVMGKRGKKKANTAGARSETARIVVGGEDGLVINAIASKAIAKRNKFGKVKRSTSVNLGDIYLGGNQIDLDQLLNPVVNGLDELLTTIGIASVKTHVVRKSKNGVGVIAVHIKLLDGKGADIKIGDVMAKVLK